MKLSSVSYFTNGGPRMPLEKGRATKGIETLVKREALDCMFEVLRTGMQWREIE